MASTSPAARARLSWALATVTALGGAAWLWATPPASRPLVPGAVLTSATGGFTLSGTISNLAPGDTSAALAITVANPYGVPITVTSITVSVSAVPAACPVSSLTLNGSSFTGSPPAVTVTGLSRSVPANGSAAVALPLLLAKTAGNGCQNVTFPFSYTGAASYTAMTTTTLSTAPNPSLFGRPATFAATVSANPAAANPAAGSVTFDRCTSPANLAAGSPASACKASVPLGPAVPVGSSGQPSLQVSNLPGGSYPVFANFAPSDPTSYSASQSAVITQTVTFSQPCITTTVPGFTVASGQSICVSAPAKVTGTITVNAGGALSVTGATLNSSLTANGAAALLICGATVTGSLSATTVSGLVMAGDGGDDGQPACAGNTLKGGVTVSQNAGGLEVAGNKISGSVAVTGNTGSGPYWLDASPEVEGNSITGALSCSGNSPAPANGGQPNAVSGSRSGQCAAAGF